MLVLECCKSWSFLLSIYIYVYIYIYILYIYIYICLYYGKAIFVLLQSCVNFIYIGTLLGAIRFGGILPWDGDGDISILHPGPLYDAEPWVDFLASKGISANMIMATYKNMSVDIMRWIPQLSYHHGVKRTYLHKHYPPDSRDSFIVKLNHKLDAFPYDWIEPRRLIDFCGIQAHIPFQAHSLLRARYPLSLGFRLPYKWKCWLPWFDK